MPFRVNVKITFQLFIRARWARDLGFGLSLGYCTHWQLKFINHGTVTSVQEHRHGISARASRGVPGTVHPPAQITLTFATIKVVESSRCCAGVS